MKKKPGGRKSWHVSTLIKRALKSSKDNSYWKCVDELRSRPTPEVFQAVKIFCGSSRIRERVFGLDVLAQLGISDRPFRKETLPIFHKMLKTESSPKVLYALLISIHYCQKPDDTRCLKAVSSFRDHSSKDVRYGVAFALAERANPISINTLIYLSRDRSSEVRDWATFGLAQQVKSDTPAIRKALFERLEDPDGDTRGEALIGLARRKDPKVKPYIKFEIERENETAYNYAYVAAKEFGDKKLISLAERQYHLLKII